MPPKSFALTRWVIDETVSAMPLTAVKKGQTPHVGAFVNVKYLGKFYEAEILMISGMCFIFLATKLCVVEQSGIQVLIPSSKSRDFARLLVQMPNAREHVYCYVNNTVHCSLVPFCHTRSTCMHKIEK